jgi:hypothetical protein
MYHAIVRRNVERLFDALGRGVVPVEATGRTGRPALART